MPRSGLLAPAPVWHSCCKDRVLPARRAAHGCAAPHSLTDFIRLKATLTLLGSLMSTVWCTSVRAMGRHSSSLTGATNVTCIAGCMCPAWACHSQHRRACCRLARQMSVWLLAHLLHYLAVNAGQLLAVLHTEDRPALCACSSQQQQQANRIQASMQGRTAWIC